MGRVAEDAADAGFGLGAENCAGRRRVGLGIGEEGGEIIFEGKCRFVFWVAFAVGARVAGAEITGRIVGDHGGLGGGLLLALPGTLGAVGGH